MFYTLYLKCSVKYLKMKNHMKSVKNFISIILQNKDLIFLINQFIKDFSNNDNSIFSNLSSSSTNPNASLNVGPDIVKKLNTIEQNYTDTEALELFNEIVRLFEITKDIVFNIKDIQLNNNSSNKKNNIVDLSKQLFEALRPIIELYREFSKVDDDSRVVIPANKTNTQEFQEDSLEKILQDAIAPQNHFKNYTLQHHELLLIQTKMGKDLFEKILKKYSLSSDNFTLDDLRMVIIGAIVNCNKSWEENQFILALLEVCNIDKNLENNQAIEQLSSKVKLDDVVLKRISQETLRETFFDEKLKFFRKHFLSSWDFLIPIRFKANKAFKRDYKSSLAIASINDWQHTRDSRVQEFASEEYLFNNLSTADFQDDTVLPILNKDGKKCFYKVKNFIDAKSIHGFALIPTDPKESLDIKVVFKNSKNLSEAILDTEHYLPFQEFKQHKKYVMQQLNQIIEEFKQHPDMSEEQTQSISLNIGGQGTGGTLASHLMHEIINQKAHFLTKDFVQQNPTEHQKTVSSIFSNNITQQFLHENSLSSSRSKSKLSSKIMSKKYSSPIEKYAEKHLFNQDQQFAQNPSLLNINNLHLSTINSGGVPEKIRNNFIQALRLLKDSNFKGPELHVSYNKIINNHDIVKKTGTTDLGAYVPPNLMHIKMLQINSEDPEFGKNLKNIGWLSLALAGKAAVNTSVLSTIPHIAPIINSIMNNIKSISENELLKNIVKNIREIWSKANNIHYNSHLNEKQSSYKVLDNTSLQEQTDIEKELNDKIDRTKNNIVYRRIKKKSYKIFRKIQNLLGTYNYNLNVASEENPENIRNIDARSQAIPQRSKTITPSFHEISNQKTSVVSNGPNIPNVSENTPYQKN